MGWRFRKSFRIVPGVRLNMGKSGFTSVSIGGRGTTLNLGKRGVASTVSLPGTGLSYQHRFKNPPPAQRALPIASVSGRTISIRACLAGAVVLVGYFVLRLPTPSPQAIPLAAVTTPVASAMVETASAAPVGP